nr:immunoglobulin heavy chain junction region [Mus musculus]MBK4185576.1 immunoglobulin heavy chain junction region [Mus musculus]
CARLGRGGFDYW